MPKRKKQSKARTADLLGVAELVEANTEQQDAYAVDDGEKSSASEEYQRRLNKKKKKKNKKKKKKKLKQKKQEKLQNGDNQSSFTSENDFNDIEAPDLDEHCTNVKTGDDVVEIEYRDSDFSSSDDSEARNARRQRRKRARQSRAGIADTDSSDKDQIKNAKTIAQILFLLLILVVISFKMNLTNGFGNDGDEIREQDYSSIANSAGDVVNFDTKANAKVVAVGKLSGTSQQHRQDDVELPPKSYFSDAATNPFLVSGNLRMYNPPRDCNEADPTFVHWKGSAHGKCPRTSSNTYSAQYSTSQLQCTSGQRVPGPLFLQSLMNEGRFQWVNFTGTESKQTVTAMVILPHRQYQQQPTPVIYALHARDQGYERIDMNGQANTAEFMMLMMGFAGWVHDAVCELNDPRMVPHTLVVPLRGGDRMWMDCHDKSACALETAIAKDLVPYVDQHFNTKTNGAKSRACMGYSMGASGCLNLALSHPSIFGSTLVQSPGVWPRFVSWSDLISGEGPKSSPFSTRSYLLEHVFGGEEDYDRRSLCNLLETQVSRGELQVDRPKIRIWFGEQDPYIEQDSMLFNCMSCNQMCSQFHAVPECTHGSFFSCLTSTSSYPTYLQDVFGIFDFD